MSLAVLQNQLVLNIEALRAELSQMRLRGASLHHRYEPQLQVRLRPVMCAQGACLAGWATSLAAAWLGPRGQARLSAWRRFGRQGDQFMSGCVRWKASRTRLWCRDRQAKPRASAEHWTPGVTGTGMRWRGCVGDSGRRGFEEADFRGAGGKKRAEHLGQPWLGG